MSRHAGKTCGCEFGSVVDRHESNATLFSAYFDKPEFRENMVGWLTEVLYKELRPEQQGVLRRLLATRVSRGRRDRPILRTASSKIVSGK